MSQSPSVPPHDGQRPPQVWDTRIEDRTPSSPPPPPTPGAPAAPGGRPFADAPTAPPGFGPAPVFGPPESSGPAPGGAGKRRKALVIGLGLLLVAGAGTGGWLLWGRGGNDPAPKKETVARPVDAKLSWMAPVPTADRDRADRMNTPWFTKDSIVITTRKEVTAFGLDDGKRKWTVQIPGRACASSPRSDGGVAAVIFGTQDFDCDKVMAIDLERGRELWSKPVVDAKGRTQSRDMANLHIEGGKVAVVDIVGDPYLYAAADGKQSKAPDYGCQQQGSVVDRGRQLTLAQCELISGRQFIMNVDPKTGLEKWTWKVLDGIAVKNVLSVNPPVLALGRENSIHTTELVSLDDKGRMRPLISMSAGPYDVSDCKPRLLDSCRKIVVDSDTVYLPTLNEKVAGDGATPNEIAAIDLTTGKPRWTVPLGGSRTNRPLAMHEGRLLVYQLATRQESGRVLSLDPRTGDSKVFMKMPQESAEREYKLARSGTAYFRDGRLHLVTDLGMTDTTMIMTFQ
ncbi:PQQ-binding-like beta-propeller repeat protein [Streptomyces sp. NPDC053048]|uniref:outer membrane protein assembly factor BamB family protein n=1 Tax=Streptomyces sp. NPDC053048 TaxID=3365694 RepID=UPI0037D91121